MAHRVKKRTRKPPPKKAKKPQGSKLAVSTSSPKARKKVPRQQKGLESIISRATEARLSRSPVSHASLPESFPIATQQNQAMLLTADPVFVFVYWSVDHASYEKILKRAGPSSKLTLRFYDITSSLDLSRSPLWDLDVFDLAGNWYLKREHPEQKLCFDIGVKNDAGDFYPVSRSNILHLPTPLIDAASPKATELPTLPMSHEELKSALGPYFFELFEKGRISTIANSSLAGIFHDISLLRHQKPATTGSA